MSTSLLQKRAGLEPYSSPLTKREVKHLLRRSSFGADPETVNAFEGKTAGEIVDTLLQFAGDPLANPLPPKPVWADLPQPDRQVTPTDVVRQYNENNRFWLDELTVEMISRFRTSGLSERMTLFWHNHFVTEVEVYGLAIYSYRYLDIIRRYSIGNLKDFVREIGLTPAMLIYLNGDSNKKGSPNENYARELLELFTMSPEDHLGNPNYTQQDIEEIARALTGWFVNREAIASELFSKEFDEGEKTFLGRTGAFDYDDVTDVIFEARAEQVACFICSKLYREFVFDVPDIEIVLGLAEIFVQNDFEIEPVLSTLLKCAHFYDPQVIGAKIKSPADLITGAVQETGLQPQEGLLNALITQFEDMEQILLDPPDVSGWHGYRAWLSTSTLPTRWAFSEFLLLSGTNNQPINLIPIALMVHDELDLLAPFQLPIALAEHFISIPVSELDIPKIEDEFSGDLVSNPVPQEILDGPKYIINLAKIFLGDIPWYEWSLSEDGANATLLSYVQFLMQLPEFQLT